MNVGGTNLGGSNSSQPIPTPNQETTVTNPTLPHEVVMHIFSQLDELSTVQAGSVDKYFNVEVLNSIKKEEFNLLNSFLDGLIGHLNTMKFETPSLRLDEVIKKLEELLMDANERKPINLLELKSSLISVKDEVVNILKQLNQYDLKTLETLTDLKTPLSWEMEIYPDIVQTEVKSTNKLFVLASLPDLASMDDEDKSEFAPAIAMCGFVDRAINLAKTISDEPTKRKTFNYLAVLLCEAGYMKKGAEVAKAQGIEKDNIFKELDQLTYTMRTLVDENKFDEIVKIADKLDVKNKDALLGFVALEFFHNAKPENAIKAYNLISDSSPSNMDAFFKQKRET